MGHSILNDVQYGGRNVGNLYKNYKLNLEGCDDKEQVHPDLIRKRDLEDFVNSSEKYIIDEENYTFANCENNTIDEIFLHSFSYKWKEYYFETPKPYWTAKHLPLNK